jgi:hypothetical protein
MLSTYYEKCAVKIDSGCISVYMYSHQSVFQRPLVPLLLLGPPFFLIILFGSTTLLTGMTGNSLHMQWPLTSQLHGSVSEENNWFFVTDQTPCPYPTRSPPPTTIKVIPIAMDVV